MFLASVGKPVAIISFLFAILIYVHLHLDTLLETADSGQCTIGEECDVIHCEPTVRLKTSY